MEKKKYKFTDCVRLSGRACTFFDGDKFYISTGALETDSINFEEVEMVTYESKPSRANLIVEDGMLLFAKMLGTKKTLMVDSTSADYIYSTGFCAVEPNQEILDGKCLFYILSSDLFLNQKDKCCSGATQKAITNQGLDKIYISVPDVQTQSEIVKALDNITNVIKYRQEQMTELDVLIKARFIELFGDPITNTKGWKIEKAEKHIDLLSGFPFDSSQYTQYGVKICGGLIIMPQRIDWDSCKYWSSTEGLEEYTLQEKDIVMALDRPWISEGFKIAMVDADELPALLIQRTARIRAVDINQYYLMHCFALGGFDSHCNVTGSLVPHISAKDIRSFPIMLPPIELQQQFAAFVEQTDKSKVVVQYQKEFKCYMHSNIE